MPAYIRAAPSALGTFRLEKIYKIEFDINLTLPSLSLNHAFTAWMGTVGADVSLVPSHGPGG